MRKKTHQTVVDALWYKDAIIYELHVKSFHDDDGDGIGDFKGLTKKLDYLQDLGVTAVWLLPFYPSPLRDDGYDISDYYSINPQYGTLNDLREFLKEAHARGLRVITELVLNHTSDQHEWFQKSRRAKAGSAWREFYVWSDTPDKYKDARIIFKDFETSNWTFDSVAKAYYWHRFYSHQPDLNFDNPAVQKAMLSVVDYWFDIGVDGMRIDAVPYLFEREGTNCENLPETYAFLVKLRQHVDRKYSDKMLLAEANQWPEDAAKYFGDGNSSHMVFHFPVMPRLFMASWMEDRFPIIDIFEQTPAIPNTCQWALFLRNHDELTLEMVSDEERDYMYRVFAKDPTARINLGIRRRLAPLLGNNRRKIELMNMLLFSLPGTPIIYYGDEIGMGDNHYLGDRNGVRTPMQWNADRNAGFSRANPQKLFLPVIIDPDYHYEAINVENQTHNLSSIFWWMKRVMTMRKHFRAFGRGTIEFVNSNNPKVLAFVRRYEEEIILVVVNLSRFSQAVELDISEFEGYVPEEVMSNNKFPAIKNSPYLFTLGFYDYYWLALRKETRSAALVEQKELPELLVPGRWDMILEGRWKERFERDIFPAYLRASRWFGGKARTIQQVRISRSLKLEMMSSSAQLIFLEIRYIESASETYFLPLVFAAGTEAESFRDSPKALIAKLKTPEAEGVLVDGLYHEELRRSLVQSIARKQSIRGSDGVMNAYASTALPKKTLPSLSELPSQVMKAEQSNTSILYGSEFLLKIFRRVEEGINPDLEITRYLTEKTSYTNVPAFGGAMEYRRQEYEPLVLGILQKFIQNQGDAWSFTLHQAGAYFERVLEKRIDFTTLPPLPSSLVQLSTGEVPEIFHELIGGVYLEMVGLLGVRTGELHLALSGERSDPKFVPEPFSILYQRSLYHSMRSLTRRVFDLLRKKVRNQSEEGKSDIEYLLANEKEILGRFNRLTSKKISSLKIRIHGDYHLGQVLFTGNDFVIIDFEGEPARPIGERRLKRSPFRDVAGMLRSFHYPTYSVLRNKPTIPENEIPGLEPWAEAWYRCVAGAFLKAYLMTVKTAPFVPANLDELNILLDALLMEKAVYEVGYELNNRPDWVGIPIRGIKSLLEN
jgi:maltose alpha-D-glucosyltransferase/alpha-amylase